MQAVARLTRIADVSSAILPECDGDIEVFINRVGRSSLGSQIDMQSVRQRFGDLKVFPRINLLVQVLERGVPIDVKPRGDLVNATSCGSHSGMDDHRGRVYEQLRADGVDGRALIFDMRQIFDTEFFRVSPIGAVVHPKCRITHDPTSSPRRMPHMTSIMRTPITCRHRRVTLMGCCI